jgi:hypothetical protein
VVGSARIGALTGSAALGIQALGDELRSYNRNLARGFDPQADLAPFEPDDGHTDVVADVQFLHELPGQDQHRVLPRVTGGDSSERDSLRAMQPIVAGVSAARSLIPYQRPARVASG